MTFFGADTEQLREMSSRTTHAAARIDELLGELSTLVASVDWVGPDADAYRDRWASEAWAPGTRASIKLEERGTQLDEEADEQDRASDDEGGGGLLESLRAPRNQESDGFFGDLLGGPESGRWATMAWNATGMGVDALSFLPMIGWPATVAGLAMDIPSTIMGLYDASQSFQDGDLYGTVDGLVTASINAADTAAGVLSIFPPTAFVGEGLGMATSGVDALWSEWTILAQVDGANGGASEGSPTRFLLEGLGVENDVLDTADSIYGTQTELIREQFPAIDHRIDQGQQFVESVIPHDAQERNEEGGEIMTRLFTNPEPWMIQDSLTAG